MVVFTEHRAARFQIYCCLQHFEQKVQNDGVKVSSRLRPADWRLDSVGRPESGGQILYLLYLYTIFYILYLVFIFVICLHHHFDVYAKCDVKTYGFETLGGNASFA